MRRIWLGVVAACGGLVLVPASPVQAEETCGGRTVTISGTEGEDIIFGTEGDDVISAKAGPDRVLALGGHDVVCLGRGDDFFDGGPGVDRVFAEAGSDGADTFHGGPDQDFVDYSLRTRPVRITLDGVANDGAPGEGDNVVAKDPTETGYTGDGIEGVVGGSGNDHLEGQNGPAQLELTNLLTGGPGNDIILGGNAKDQLHGNDGIDQIAGLGGDDIIIGHGGNDVLGGNEGFDQVGGGDGNDTILGGPNGDLLGGGAGDDVFITEPVPGHGDAIYGFTGVDTVTYARRALGVKVKPLFFGSDPAIEDQISTDVEVIVGSQGNDIIEITASGGVGNDNRVDGGPGDDRIDVTDGVRGNDRVTGGDGTDTCRGDRDDVQLSCP